MDLLPTNGLTGGNIQAGGKIIKWMGLVSLCGPMVESILVNSKIRISMDMEFYKEQMGNFIKAIGDMEMRTDLESTKKIGIIWNMLYGRMENRLNSLINKKLNKSIMDKSILNRTLKLNSINKLNQSKVLKSHSISILKLKK